MKGGSDQRDGDSVAEQARPGAGERLPLLAVDGRTLFPHTVVPFNIYDPAALGVVDESLTERRLLVVVATTGVDGDAPKVGVVGRIVSDRRVGDGRTEVFVHGIERAALSHRGSGRADIHPLRDEARVDATVLDGLVRRIVELATTLARTSGVRGAEIGRIVGASSGPGVLSDRLAHVLVDDLELRQALLETTCPAERCAALEQVLVDELLAATPTDVGWVN